MSDKQPIIIKRGTFVCTIYDVGSLMELPLANVRKLWKIMLDAAWENEETISTIRAWLTAAIDQTKEQQMAYANLLDGERTAAETVRRTVAAFGSAATTDHERAKKLQTIFTEMAVKARI